LKKTKALLILLLILVVGLVSASYVSATPSASFYEADGDVFDNWGISRTRAFGKDGFYQLSDISFRPVIVFESLGGNSALAYSLGEQIAGEYPDRVQRAESVFYFVRDRVSYTPDIDQFPYEEFAQNADELAAIIDQNKLGYGDCEDSAVLLAVMFKGAGYRSAIAISSNHTAALVYLPEYKQANIIFELRGEPGWVWAEATGKNNPLGWVPEDFIDVKLAAYEISAEAIAPVKLPATPPVAIIPAGDKTSSRPFLFIGIIVILLLLPLFRRRRVS